MSHYLLIESRDPYQHRSSPYFDLAADLSARGSEVTLFLVQNAVFALRGPQAGAALDRMAQAGVTLIADSFSLKERGIEPATHQHVKPAALDLIIDMMVAGHKTIWH